MDKIYVQNVHIIVTILKINVKFFFSSVWSLRINRTFFPEREIKSFTYQYWKIIRI